MDDQTFGLEAHVRVEELLGRETMQVPIRYLKSLLKASQALHQLCSIAAQQGLAIEPTFVDNRWTLVLTSSHTIWASAGGDELIDSVCELLQSLEPVVPDVVKPEHQLQLAIDRRRKTFSSK